MDTNSAPSAIRSNKVDFLSTKNLDMHKRRCVDAAPAQDPNDYVILDQLNQAINKLNTSIADINNQIATINSSLIPGSVNTLTSTLDLTLTVTPTDVPGLSISVGRVGLYIAFADAFLNLQGGAGDLGQTLAMSMRIAGTLLAAGSFIPISNLVGTTVGGGTVSQSHAFRVYTVPTVVTLRAWKSGGTGTSVAKNGLCTLSVLWVGL